jgi:uncharacterized membrane protein
MIEILVWYLIAACCWAILYAFIQEKFRPGRFSLLGVAVIGLFFPITIAVLVGTFLVGFTQGCMNILSK